MRSGTATCDPLQTRALRATIGPQAGVDCFSMARSKGSGRGLTLAGINVEPDVYRALAEYAAQHEMTISEAGRKLLRSALSETSGLGDLASRDLEDDGYNEGLRRGLREARAAIQHGYSES